MGRMDRSDFERMADQRVAPRNKQLIDHFSGDLCGDWSPNRRTFAERLGGVAREMGHGKRFAPPTTWPTSKRL